MSKLAVRGEVHGAREEEQSLERGNIIYLNMKTLNKFFERVYGSPMRELTMLFFISATWLFGTWSVMIVVMRS